MGKIWSERQSISPGAQRKDKTIMCHKTKMSRGLHKRGLRLTAHQRCLVWNTVFQHIIPITFFRISEYSNC